MPTSIPSALITEKNKLFTSGVYLELLEIQMTEPAVTLRFVNNDEDITWNSQTWTKFPFEFADVEETSKGVDPTVELRVSNVGRTLGGYIVDTTGGLVGDTVIYRVVHSEHLSETTPYVTNYFNILSTTIGPTWVTFVLGAENLYFRRFPQNYIKRNLCRWKVFKGTECGYGGSETTCDRTFDQCIIYGNQLNFGGFPGLPGGAILGGGSGGATFSVAEAASS